MLAVLIANRAELELENGRKACWLERRAGREMVARKMAEKPGGGDLRCVGVCVCVRIYNYCPPVGGGSEMPFDCRPSAKGRPITNG